MLCSKRNREVVPVRIGEAAKATNLSIHTLRYYEDIGLIRSVARDGQDKRTYSEADLKWIRFLKSLKGTGMPLTDVVRYAELYYSGDHSIPKRIELLGSYRDRLVEEAKNISESIEFLNNKIAFYNNKLDSIESSQDGCL